MVNEEHSITFPLYSFSWNHYIFNLDSFIYIQSIEAFSSLYIFPCRSLSFVVVVMPSSTLLLSWSCPCRPPIGSSSMGKSRMKTGIFLHGRSFFLLFWLCSSQIQTADALTNSTLGLNYESNLLLIFRLFPGFEF